MPFVYILFSNSLEKYYIGSTTTLPEIRLKKHLTYHKGFTGRAKDWIIVYSEEFPTKQQAYKKELEIKSWKSQVMIQRLLNHQV